MEVRDGDYMYYLGPIGSVKRDKYKKKRWIDMKSITKMFLLFVLLDLGVGLNDKITKYFPDYPYKNISVKQIINHTSGLVNDWGGSGLQKRYWKSKDINKFALNLKMVKEDYGKFKYNNYTYNILSAIIKKITGKNWNEVLKFVFPKATFKIHKLNGVPFASHSLFIDKNDIPYISKMILKNGYHSRIKSKKLIPKTQKYYRKLIKGVEFSGHDGSGGQDLMFNNKEIFWVLSYDNPDVHKRGLKEEEVKYHLMKFRDSKSRKRSGKR